MPQDQIVTGSTTLTPFQATYHWRNKNCFPWSEQWFKDNLPTTSASSPSDGSVSGSGNGNSVEVTRVTEVEGDVDLGQRKGKLLTIFDCRVVMQWKGKTAEGDEVEGTVTVPEVSHEMLDGHDTYTFEFSSTSSKSFNTFLRSEFTKSLTSRLNDFAPALVATHGQPTSGADSGASTPNPNAQASSSKGYSPAEPVKIDAAVAAAKKAEEKKEAGLVGGTSTVSTETRLQASGADVWGLLTDEKRVPMWTRAPAKISPTPGSEFEMFGGNIRGKIVSAEAEKKLVQSWQLRNPNWPSDHYAEMTIALDQGDDSTAVTFTLAGVPKGQEEIIKGAIETYYVRGFKQIGLVISTSPYRITKDVTSRPSIRRKTPAKRKSKPGQNAGHWGDYVGYGLIAASAIALVGIVWSSFR